VYGVYFFARTTAAYFQCRVLGGAHLLCHAMTPIKSTAPHRLPIYDYYLHFHEICDAAGQQYSKYPKPTSFGKYLNVLRNVVNKQVTRYQRNRKPLTVQRTPGIISLFYGVTFFYCVVERERRETASPYFFAGSRRILRWLLLMKIFCSRSSAVVEECRIMFGVPSITDQIHTRKIKLLQKFCESDNCLCALFAGNASRECASVC